LVAKSSRTPFLPPKKPTLTKTETTRRPRKERPKRLRIVKMKDGDPAVPMAKKKKKKKA
jgi:hypothetical protein